jgi:diacylglycerol kinase (ATP)
MRIGLLSNTASERNRKGMASLLPVIERHPEILHRVFASEEGFGPPLRAMAEAGSGLVVINSGDGTVHGVLTELLARRPFAELPKLAILPRGMANMTAADCGLLGADARTLERLIETARAGRLDQHLAVRHILKVDHADGAAAPRGMFFGAAGIVDVIRHVTRKLHTKGIKGEWSHAAAMLGLLGGTLVKGFEALGLKPHDVGIGIDGGDVRDERLLILLATTLERLVLRSRPFWGVGKKPIRHTRISHPPKGLIRKAPRILYGPDDRRLPEADYRSGGAVRLTLRLDAPFTIDGEFFTPARDRPVTVTADETIAFVRL